MSWKDLNDTELVALTLQVNPHVHRGYPRKFLIEILEEEADPELPPRRIDEARGDIFSMVDLFWSQVESLISCPMKSRSPGACFGCTDIQVAECSVLNRKLIQDAKKENRNE